MAFPHSKESDQELLDRAVLLGQRSLSPNQYEPFSEAVVAIRESIAHRTRPEEDGPRVPQGIEQGVCEDIARRQQLGIAKYGQTVANNPLELKQWLQHAYEETLDKAVYLKRAISEIEVKSGGATLTDARYDRIEAGAKPFFPGDPGYENARYEVVLFRTREK